METKLEILERKLNIASKFMEELDLDGVLEPNEKATEVDIPNDCDDIIEDCSNLVIPEICTSVAIAPTDEEKFEVFSVETLKADFMAIRQQILSLVNSGQNILKSASVLDISDLKANQLQALAQLQATLGNNLELLFKIYKQIVEIEKTRMTSKKPEIPTNAGNVNNGTVVNNQIMFNGDTSQLLDFIKQNQTT